MPDFAPKTPAASPPQGAVSGLGRPGAGRPGTSRHHRVLLPLLAALVTLAWLALWAWAASPYARYLAHGDWLADGPVAVLCRAIPGGAVLVPALIMGLAWILMSGAMMLPTALPLFERSEEHTSELQSQ